MFSCTNPAAPETSASKHLGVLSLAQHAARLPVHIKLFLPWSKDYPDSILPAHVTGITPMPDGSEPWNLQFKASGGSKARDEQQNPQAPEGQGQGSTTVKTKPIAEGQIHC